MRQRGFDRKGDASMKRRGRGTALAVLVMLTVACSDDLRDMVLTGHCIAVDPGTTVVSTAALGEQLLRQGGLAVWGINTRQGTFARGGDYGDERFRVPHLFPGRFRYAGGEWVGAGSQASDSAAVWPADDLLTLMAVSPADFEASGFEAMGDYADTRRFALTFTGEGLPTGPLLVAQVTQQVYSEQKTGVRFRLTDMLAAMSFRLHNELDDDIDSLVAVGVSGRFPMARGDRRPRVLLDELLPEWENLTDGRLDYGHHQATVFRQRGVERFGTTGTPEDRPLFFFPGFAQDVRFEIVYTLRDSAGTYRREATLAGVKRLEQGKHYLMDITLKER